MYVCVQSIIKAWKWQRVAQSGLTLCDPMDYTVHGIFQAQILEWVAIPFSRGSSQPRSPALHADSLLSEPPGKPGVPQIQFLSCDRSLLHVQPLPRPLCHPCETWRARGPGSLWTHAACSYVDSKILHLWSRHLCLLLASMKLAG